MDFHLLDKVAVVTGASKGIGLAVARALISEGARVVAGARHTTNELAELTASSRARFVAVDLSTPAGPAHLVDEAVAAFGRLDVLVNNAGAAHPRPGGFLSLTDEDWQATLTLDFLAAVRATRAALPHLLRSWSATIVTVSSVNAFLPDPMVIDYCAAKGALTNFFKSLS